MKTPINFCHSILIALIIAALPLPITRSQEEASPAVTAEESPPAEEKENFDAQLKQVIDELDSDDFRTREEATVKLWKIGDRAEAAVRELAKSRDIELRTRAARLLGLYKFGIYPDTPPETLKLINQFRHGDQREKTSALRQLYEKGNTSAVMRLVRSIDNQQLRSQLLNTVVSSLDEKISELLTAGSYDDIEDLLALAAISDEGLRNLAVFHLHRGTIDREIEALLEKDKAGEASPIEYEQLTWLYRAKGDLESALAAADSAENEDLVTSTRIAQGDLIAFIKSCFNPNDRTIQTYGFTAAQQRLEGDQEGLEKTVATIKQYAANNPEEERACLDALLINGRTAEAIEIATLGSAERTQLLIDNGEHARALAELGIANPKPPYNDWLDQLVEKFSSGESDFKQVYTVVRLLKGWGEDAEAARIYQTLGETVRENDPESLPRIIANASVLDLPDIALEFTRSAFKIEAKAALPDPSLEGIEREQARAQNQVGLLDAEESLVSALFWNNAQTADFWWGRLRSKLPEESSLQRLDRLSTLLTATPENKDATIKLLEKLQPDEENPDVSDDPILIQSNMAEIYLRLEDEEKAMEWLRKTLVPNREGSADSYNFYANRLMTENKWEEALPHFKAATEVAPALVYCLIRYGIALEHNKQPEEAAAAIKRAHLMALGRPEEMSRIADAFAASGEYVRAQEVNQRILDLAVTEEPAALFKAFELAEYLSIEQPARAAMYKERYLIEFLKGHRVLRSITNAPSIRGSIGSLQARAAVKAGRPEEAVAILEELVDKQPSNSSLVEDLYPMLVMAGHKAEADKFYQKLNDYGENALKLFPNSAQDLNSNAWLKSRCGKDLDTALRRSVKSNELSKNNAAYIDTLAEVYFQKGDRSNAIDYSEKAVKLSGGDFLLHHQLQRFKNSKPLSETLPSTSSDSD